MQILYDVRAETNFQLLAFCVMPDHLHLILVPPPKQLGRIIQLIKGRFARAYNQQEGIAGSVWQSRYHERTLYREQALSNAIEYVHNNPVVARLADRPDQYPWSSANEHYPTDLARYFGQPWAGPARSDRPGSGQAEA
jgi:REP element-mobilizing transposase RayT